MECVIWHLKFWTKREKIFTWIKQTVAKHKIKQLASHCLTSENLQQVYQGSSPWSATIYKDIIFKENKSRCCFIVFSILAFNMLTEQSTITNSVKVNSVKVDDKETYSCRLHRKCNLWFCKCVVVSKTTNCNCKSLDADGRKSRQILKILHKKYRKWLQWRLFTVFKLSASRQLFLCNNLALLHSWLMDQQQHKQE